MVSTLDLDGGGPAQRAGNPYDGLLPDEDFPVFDKLPLGSLRVLRLPAQAPRFEDNLPCSPATLEWRQDPESRTYPDPNGGLVPVTR